MVKELKHVIDGKLRGFTTEDRTSKDGNQFKVDVMVLDQDMDTHRITMKRKDADELKPQFKGGELVSVEVLLRGFADGIGISFLRLINSNKK